MLWCQGFTVCVLLLRLIFGSDVLFGVLGCSENILYYVKFYHSRSCYIKSSVIFKHIMLLYIIHMMYRILCYIAR